MKVTPFTDKPIKVLEYDGTPAIDLNQLGLSKDEYLSIYRWRVFARAVDDRGYILVRQGRSGFYAQISGQEASQIGSALPLERNDYLFGDHRSQGSMLVKGLLAAEWGRTADNRRARYYRITAAGRRQLEREIASYRRVSQAIALILQPA